MEKIWIIGGGQFGQLGAARMAAKSGNCRLTVVDEDPVMLDQLDGLDCIRVKQDGAAFLADRLGAGDDPDWIVPAVPVHLAWEWCRLILGRDRLISQELPETIDSILPNSMRSTGHDIYVSFADFLCPDNCPEPAGKCTVTGKPREHAMHDYLAGVRFESYQPLVVKSRQLGPGVGGYRPRSLFDMLDRFRNGTGPFLAATACLCHGVVTGVKKLEKSEK